MSHIHPVVDTDVHYKIDGITRTITNIDETKRELVQNDHNSERFTFELPRYFDGHDFSECNVVQVHYENADAFGKNKSSGIYIVDDLHINTTDNDTVILSWLVSSDATKYVGTLSFAIRFSCVTDTVDYAWNTKKFDGIVILEGVYNSGLVPDPTPSEYEQLVAIATEAKQMAQEAVDIAESAILTDTATGLKYQLQVVNGKLTMQEVAE